jgi:hypothetical protein
MPAEVTTVPERAEIIAQTMILPAGMLHDDENLHLFVLRVEWRGADDEHPNGTWRVTDGFRELSRAGNWGHPQKFQRHQYRWSTREEALDMARRHVDAVKVNGRTWAEWAELERG